MSLYVNKNLSLCRIAPNYFEKHQLTLNKMHFSWCFPKKFGLVDCDRLSMP